MFESDIPKTAPSLIPPDEPEEISTVCPTKKKGEISSNSFSDSDFKIPENSFFVAEPQGPDRSVLIRLDPLLVSAIDFERAQETNRAGKHPPRTKVMRDLLREALDSRQEARGEDLPTVEATKGPAA